MEEATSATPTPLEGLGHNWVAGEPLSVPLYILTLSPPEWLRMIGLPGYVRTFVEARIDGHMLNVISMVTNHMIQFFILTLSPQGDLDLLEVNDPFHQLSLQRAIQAFR